MGCNGLLTATAALLLAMTQATPTQAAQSSLEIEPEAYDGPRGSEPYFQNIVRATLEQSHVTGSLDGRYKLLGHFEAETTGRRDSSLDLDQAWWEPIGGLYIGRIHPWDTSGHPEASRPWGLLGQTQSQNKGIELGSPLHAGELSPFPEPVVMGWLGAHYWSDPEGRDDFALGASASPLFVPSLGSEVSLSETQATSYGRFGRRPPGFVQLNGSNYPLFYQLHTNLSDILLQPQLMVQARWRLSHGLTTWVTASRSPQPDPSTGDTSGFLNISQDSISAVAKVTPSFPELWLGTLTEEWKPGFAPLGLRAFGTAMSWQRTAWGYEIGVRNEAYSLSYLNESTRGTSAYLNPGYLQSLLQFEGKTPVSLLTLFYGIKRHLQTDGTWLRGGVEWRPEPRMALRLGFDLFGGDETTYFGEWRTNDRGFFALTLFF